jgi:hypothetical protein
MPGASPKREKQVRQQRRNIASNMGAEGDILKASLIERFTVCRRAGCHCMKGKKHGPYLYASVFDGKQSRQVYVPQSMHSEVRKWVQNAQDVSETVSKLSNLSVNLIRLRQSGASGMSVDHRPAKPQVRR